MADGWKSFVILHFNDVYEIEGDSGEEIPGGAARFVTLVKQQREKDEAIVFFSGDCFNPSLLSVTTRGNHMVPVINSFNIAASVLGNHDFDFGLPELLKLMAQCNFSWVLSNAVDKTTGKKLANAREYDVFRHQGVKIGVIGLIEREWMDTLSAVDSDTIDYEDFVDAARRVSSILRNEESVDLVVALTHMRVPNDERLAREAPEAVDLILGGHDHDEYTNEINGVRIVKSGTDFRLLGRIEVNLAPRRRPSFNVNFLTPTREVLPDPETKSFVSSYMAGMDVMLDEVIGETAVELDATFSAIRSRETNIGNFVCDALRYGLSADVALLNSGTLRADKVFRVGKLKQRFLLELLPMIDCCVLLSVTGAQLIKALENGVSKYPRLEGRFPLVSGVSFTFDADRPEGSRILSESVKVDGERIAMDKEYKLATKLYLAEGHDGYDVLKEAKLILEDERCTNLNTMMKNRFTTLAALNKWCDTVRPPMVRRAVALFRKQSVSPAVQDQFVLNPAVEGRIVQIGGSNAKLEKSKSMDEAELAEHLTQEF